MIDWEKYPEAVEASVCYYAESGKPLGYAVFSKEQQKTAADAVEQGQPHFKATRENLEKIAKDAQGDFVEVEQEVEKWTHTLDGRKCKIIINKPDVDEDIVVLCKEGDYQVVGHEALKPIKPTISEDAKRQLELYVQYRVDKYGDYSMKSDLSDYLSHHEII